MGGAFYYKQKIGSFRADYIAKYPTITDEPVTTASEGVDMNEY